MLTSINGALSCAALTGGTSEGRDETVGDCCLRELTFDEMEIKQAPGISDFGLWPPEKCLWNLLQRIIARLKNVDLCQGSIEKSFFIVDCK